MNGKFNESIDDIFIRILIGLDQCTEKIPQTQPVTDTIMTLHLIKKQHLL